VRLFGVKDVEIVPVSSKDLNRPAKRPLYSVFNCQRLEKEARMEMRPWQEALKDYFARRGHE
jgi:dTDP-4-dehydrorhamnose reductase